MDHRRHFILAVSISIRASWRFHIYRMILECWGEIARDVTPSIHPVVRIHTYRRKCKFGEGTVNGRRPRPIPGLQGPSTLRRQCCRVAHGRCRFRKDFQSLNGRNYEGKVVEWLCLKMAKASLCSRNEPRENVRPEDSRREG